MANVVLPTVIQGPALISIAGNVHYTQKDISVEQTTESWNPESAYGPLGQRHKSRKDVITFTPVGMLTAARLNLFYFAHLDPTKIGTSIFTGTGVVFVSSISENKTYTWRRGGISKPPGLALKPTATVFGSMSVTCIGAAAVQPLDAHWWQAAEAAATADATFSQTSIISDIYSAALGARATPFDAMGGMNGFDVDFGFNVKEIPASDVGIADIVLEGLSTSVTFAPSNLTDAQVNTLVRVQDATAVLPGQPYAKEMEDLIITGTQLGWIFNIDSVGAKRANRVLQVGEHRFKLIEFVNQRLWTAGAPDPLFAYTAPA
jgi:hypothetical protein